MWSLAALGAGLLLLVLVGLLWLTAVVAWGERRTRGLSYFGLPPDQRERFRRRLRLHGTLLAPMIRLLTRISPFDFQRASFAYEGVSGPRGSCTLESFEAGASYEPSSRDVFVVTQMRSGTTWTQYLVYEILMRGEGDLIRKGSTLNAVSPWLESVIGVPVEAAPLIGRERPSRIIKTHFPVALCPYASNAKYIYVARHPASCFASCVDFLADALGATAPPVDDIEAWFCSHDLMWWGSWPRHVDGWWSLSRRDDNVLFVRFEAMLEDLPAVVADVASFLGVGPLDGDALDAVCARAGFSHMKRHQDAFEMYPPHVLATDSSYLARGTADRFRDVPQSARRRVMHWCRTELAESRFPFDALYPEGP